MRTIQKNTEPSKASHLSKEIRCNVMAVGCPSRQILQHLTSRWGVLIIVSLREKTHRFSSLRRHIEGVSERMLAQTLQSLENDGMVNRHSFETIPPHVEYSLTPIGRTIAEKLQDLVLIIEDHQSEILNKS
ncbi:winged helix-turn-helix transcriptional regulator [Serratia liquefaciens]|uniref:winged helix-turn-helix transcriptional regulator n=1 Tax=Serratia liquefaciens TaxID=614 RepID=UPI002182F852|nr:helix-turn-helix domain-containing protein [Serratia liquefaciens]CAI2535614.1 Uncharacterized HTH-type transcriptional regulator yybR [Serratia liquefaciens]